MAVLVSGLIDPYEMPTYLNVCIENQAKNVVLVMRGRALYIDVWSLRLRIGLGDLVGKPPP